MKSPKPRIRTIVAVMCLVSALPAWAEKSPIPLAADERIRFLSYDEFQVYKVIANYGYAVTIEFGPEEVIETISAGDTISWQIVPAGRRLFIKPMEKDAHTNMTVVTTKNTYNFDLDAVEPKTDVAQTYLIKFRYSEASGVISTGAAGAKTDNTLPATRNLIGAPRLAADFNFDYRLKGDKDIMPTFVFDDGAFTYFQFADKRNKALPAIFLVDKDGNESVVNYRIEGEYMVVERLGKTYTLRSGGAVVCVKNNRQESVVERPQEEKAPDYQGVPYES